MAFELAYAPSPTHYAEDGPQPVSRTYQYRKVMKPMLERKRRARINRCLDELKDLMVSALQAEGGNVAKLEKADILELTVKHLQSLRGKRRPSAASPASADRFRAGFTHAAAEVSRCLAATPGVDVALGTKLMTHLGHRLNRMDRDRTRLEPLDVDVDVASSSSSSSSSPCPSPRSCYGLPLTPACSPSPPMSPQPLDCSVHSTAGLLRFAAKEDSVWRPW